MDLQGIRSQQWLTAGLQPAVSVVISFPKLTDLGWKSSPLQLGTPSYLFWETDPLTLHIKEI